MTLQTADAGDFLASSPKPVNASSAWSSRYAVELKRVLLEQAANAPRTLQQHLGPSELGVACDRQVVGKMAALPVENHVADPWPSIVGTALHAYEADAFDADNDRTGLLRWVTETRVTPHPNHPGTADLYDAVEYAVVDHKNLGKTSMTKIRKGLREGLALDALRPRQYVVQLLLYGLGYLNAGLPVRRVVIAAWPRTESYIDDLYVWDRTISEDGKTLLPDAVELLATVFEQTAARRAQADQLIAGQLRLEDVTATPDDEDCFYCPLYRPDVVRTGGAGCAGTALARGGAL